MTTPGQEAGAVGRRVTVDVDAQSVGDEGETMGTRRNTSDAPACPRRARAGQIVVLTAAATNSQVSSGT